MTNTESQYEIYLFFPFSLDTKLNNHLYNAENLASAICTMHMLCKFDQFQNTEYITQFAKDKPHKPFTPILIKYTRRHRS